MTNRTYDDFAGAQPESKQRRAERKKAEAEAAEGAPQFECVECHVKYAVWFGKFVKPALLDDGSDPCFVCKNCRELLANDYIDVNFPRE